MQSDLWVRLLDEEITRHDMPICVIVYTQRCGCGYNSESLQLQILPPNCIAVSYSNYIPVIGFHYRPRILGTTFVSGMKQYLGAEPRWTQIDSELD